MAPSSLGLKAFRKTPPSRRGVSRAAAGRALVALSIAAAWFILSTQSASAEAIDSWASLEAILDDQLEMEDFEGLSLHGGTSIEAPNPLNAATAPPSWGIQPGVSYASPNALRLYARQLLGDDSNMLAAVGHPTLNTLNISFDTPQRAFGLYLVNITGNLDYDETVAVSSGAATLDAVSLTLPRGSEMFFGRQFDVGVTAIRLTSTAFALVDNVTWGVTLDALAGDYNRDSNVDGADFLLWQRGESPAPITELDLAAWKANFVAPLAARPVPESISTSRMAALVTVVIGLWKRGKYSHATPAPS